MERLFVLFCLLISDIFIFSKLKEAGELKLKWQILLVIFIFFYPIIMLIIYTLIFWDMDYIYAYVVIHIMLTLFGLLIFSIDILLNLTKGLDINILTKFRENKEKIRLVLFIILIFIQVSTLMYKPLLMELNNIILTSNDIK